MREWQKKIEPRVVVVVVLHTIEPLFKKVACAHPLERDVEIKYRVVVVEVNYILIKLTVFNTL